MHPLLLKSYWVLVALGAVYALFIGALCSPTVQRHSLYANKFVNAFWVDLDTPSKYGFADHQVTPFNLKTPDGESLYCWHVMPMQLYAKHEMKIRARSSEPKSDFTQTIAYELLSRDPDAKVVINFHGNAGNIAQGWRTSTYLALTSTSEHTHLLTCDYRGFGRSTGSPTEAGILTDSISLVNYALDDLDLAPQNMMLLGQSLGTAVTSGVALWFIAPDVVTSSATTDSPLFPTDMAVKPRQEGVRFAGVGLTSPFTNIPHLMRSYRIFGFMPVLSPLRAYPKVQRLVVSYILDRWETDRRIAALVKYLAEQKDGEKMLLQLVHSRDDADISFRESQRLFEDAGDAIGEWDQAHQATQAVNQGARGAVATLEKGKVEVDLTITKYGGHNRLNSFAPVILGVMRALDLNV